MAIVCLNDDGTVRDDLAEQFRAARPGASDERVDRFVESVRQRVAQGLPPIITPAQRAEIADGLARPVLSQSSGR